MKGVGVEWLIEAGGCDPSLLRDLSALRGLLETVIRDLGLRVAGPYPEGMWHVFPGFSGITGLYLLTESHLACHTYPEYNLATFNLYCCRPRGEWPWTEGLKTSLGARDVRVRALDRGVTL